MTIRIVRLGSPRAAGEGLRIGTVRRPPRGVAKARYAAENWYDAWLPELAPGEKAVKLGQKAQSENGWQAFARKYRAEMRTPAAARPLYLLAALAWPP